MGVARKTGGLSNKKDKLKHKGRRPKKNGKKSDIVTKGGGVMTKTIFLIVLKE